MKPPQARICLGLFLLVGLLSVNTAFADKAAVSIQAPADVAKGAEITIRLTITHSANNLTHHVEWVKVWINSQEFAKFDYSAFHLPEGATFTKELKYTVNAPIEIKSEASCNIHGSKGPVNWKVTLKE